MRRTIRGRGETADAGWGRIVIEGRRVRGHGLQQGACQYEPTAAEPDSVPAIGYWNCVTLRAGIREDG